MAALPPLASVDDVASRLGRDVTEQEAIRLEPLLADASAQVRRYCRRDFMLHADETQVLTGHDSEIFLPGYPVQSVSSVVAVGGAPGLPDVAIPWFMFDGVRTVRIGSFSSVINLPEVWLLDADAYPGTYRVTYTWGDAEVPDLVTMVVSNAALAVVTAPTTAAGVVSESIGPIQLPAGAGRRRCFGGLVGGRPGVAEGLPRRGANPPGAAPVTGPLLGGVTVTLLSSTVTTRDEFGNDVRNVTSTEIRGCALAPGGTSEDIQGTEQVTADAELFMPAGTAVTPEDRIVCQGVTYEVTGAAEAWTSPFTSFRGPVRSGSRSSPGQADAK